MTEDLQLLLEKIQREGIDKAQAEADKIIQNAEKQSKALVAEAGKQAEKLKSDAKEESDAYAARAEESIRQAARDIILNVEKSVTSLFENLLLQDVNEALKDQERVAELIKEAVKAYLQDGQSLEIGVAEEMAEALRAKLASTAGQGVEIITDKTIGTGFRVKLADGRIEHDFTGAAIVETLAKQLRPGLTRLLES
jgi:V/A-type H+/Na+-transporting ATPase subunit E